MKISTKNMVTQPPQFRVHVFDRSLSSYILSCKRCEYSVYISIIYDIQLKSSIFAQDSSFSSRMKGRYGFQNYLIIQNTPRSKELPFRFFFMGDRPDLKLSSFDSYNGNGLLALEHRREYSPLVK